MAVIIPAIVGMLAGAIAWLLASGRGFGLIGGMALGILGAVLSTWLLPRIGLAPFGGLARDVVDAAIGAGALLALAALRVRPHGPGAMFMGFRPR